MKKLRNKPKGPSERATCAPTEHSRSVEERLGELGTDLVAERWRRRLIHASLTAVSLTVLSVAAEITALGTGLVEQRATQTAILFAASAGLALPGAAAALIRLTRLSEDRQLLSTRCLVMIELAAVLGVVGAFVTAWP